jgi:catechol-2,3-dioxygenase
VCVKVGDSLDELREAKAALEARGLTVKDPMDHGACQSIYVTDPDGHVFEITVDKHPETWPDDPKVVSVAEPLVL